MAWPAITAKGTPSPVAGRRSVAAPASVRGGADAKSARAQSRQEAGERPLIAVIGGLDPTGHAGILVDTLVALSCGCEPYVVTTAQTAQTDTEVTGFQPSSVSAIEASLRGLDGRPVSSVKIGMLGSPQVCHVVAEWLGAHGAATVVLDPVLAAGSGGSLSEAHLVDAMRHDLFPLVTVLTPNADEAGAFWGREIADTAGLQSAAEQLAAQGPSWVLAKGGHVEGGESVDVLAGPCGVERLEGERVDVGRRVRGTGCILSTALACNLASGVDIPTAARRAKEIVAEAIRNATETVKGAWAAAFTVSLGSR